MSEFFLELFSEEIPASLQKELRVQLLENFNKLFEEKQISFKKSLSYSTPSRLLILFEGVKKEIIQKEQEIKGPNSNAPEKAIEGFLRSNKVTKGQIFKKKIDKGEFYFYKKYSKKIKTFDLLEEFIPQLLTKFQWKKSMKWGDFNLSWGRPLKSILAVFDKKTLNFQLHHLKSSNTTYIDKELESKKKIFKNYTTYKNFFSKLGIIINNYERKKIIEKEFSKIITKKNVIIENNPKLLEEIINITDQPNILLCKFDEKYLKIPKEILVITMQQHQKYFPIIDKKGNVVNEFLVVANNKDIKGLIKLGNERVVEARLSDAEFFWNKDRSQNLVKQVSKLKSINYFKGLGTYYDKAQRIRKLGAMLSDELLVSKEKVDLSASICKVDLLSDLVREFPELQGIMGGYFSEDQGFDKDTTLALKEQYLPVGLDSKNPKKPFSIILSLVDKIDTLVGFFGINLKPSSSKDPYALRRLALGVIRIIVENKKKFKIKDLIYQSQSLYQNQSFEFENKNLTKELIDFLTNRLRYYMKEKEIRNDIIEACIKSFNIDQSVIIFEKAKSLNKIINNQTGRDIILSYKRACSILDSNIKDNTIELNNTTDPGIFKTEFEKNLFKKIKDLNKYFSSINDDENYEETLLKLADSKKVIFDFFENVKVNEEDQNIKKNRLELIQMLCKTFENYMSFSIIEGN